MKIATPLLRPALLLMSLSLLGAGGCKEREETPSHQSPSQIQHELELTRAVLEGGESREAVRRAFALSESNPDHNEARVLLASALILDGDPIKALIEANRVVKADPGLVGGWVAKCAALQGQRRVEEGIEACERALTIEATHGAALKNLAALYGLKSQWDKQETMLQRLKEVAPDDAGLRIAVASNQAAQGKTSQAIEEAKAGVARDPKNVDLLFFIAQASWEIDEMEQAMEYAELGVKFAPERTEIRDLFERAFMVVIASRLTCAHGRGPWTRDQKKDAMANTGLRGVGGVIHFQRYRRDYGKRGDVVRRLRTAVKKCQQPDAPLGVAPAEPPPPGGAEAAGARPPEAPEPAP